MTSQHLNEKFLSKLFHSGYGRPVNDGRRKEWNPKKNLSRRARRARGKVHTRKAWRMLAQLGADSMREMLNRPSIGRAIFGLEQEGRVS